VGRVLTNLAINAIKFCGEPGLVRITAHVSPDSSDVIFSVEDNGPGIDASGLEQIFTRFQQLANGSRSSCKGFGLGLAIAKELVDLNLGRMTVESKPGEGSAFRFSVPMNEPLELMKRFLNYVRHEAGCPPIVSLVVARVAVAPGQRTNDGIDGFLNYLLRRNDLLLQGQVGEWFLALPTDTHEVQEYFARSNQAWEDANRNRPFGPLPPISYECLGSWRIPDEEGFILETMAQQLTIGTIYKQELACV
jgi:hypothetical protein